MDDNEQCLMTFNDFVSAVMITSENSGKSFSSNHGMVINHTNIIRIRS
jgi:hypothetical protein